MQVNYLMHHGIKGQKWGERNYQYEDGSLTPEGRERYGVGDGKKKRLLEREDLYGADARRRVRNLKTNVIGGLVGGGLLAAGFALDRLVPGFNGWGTVVGAGLGAAVSIGTSVAEWHSNMTYQEEKADYYARKGAEATKALMSKS